MGYWVSWHIFVLKITIWFEARAAFRSFAREEMKAPIAITRVKVGSAQNHPFIKPTDFVRGLDKSKKLQIILPHKDLEKSKQTLVEFWRRWKLQYGAEHTVFKEVREEDLQTLLPVRLHGDEGRSVLANMGFSEPSFVLQISWKLRFGSNLFAGAW